MNITLSVLGLIHGNQNYGDDICVPRDIIDHDDALVALKNYIPFRLICKLNNNKICTVKVIPFCFEPLMMSKNLSNYTNNIILDQNSPYYEFALKLLPILLHSSLNRHTGIPYYKFEDKTCSVKFIDDKNSITKQYVYTWNNGIIVAQHNVTRCNLFNIIDDMSISNTNYLTIVPFYTLMIERRNTLEITRQISNKIFDTILNLDSYTFNVFWSYKPTDLTAIITIIIESNTFILTIYHNNYIVIKKNDVNKEYNKNKESDMIISGSIEDIDFVNAIVDKILSIGQEAI